MSNLHKEEVLPPDKLAALEQLLRKKGINVPQTQTIPRRSTSQRLPLSFAQQRLWFLDQLEPGSAAFNLATVMRMQGELDVAALRSSLHEVMRRHESLRTTFLTVDGQPEQVIQSDISLPLPVVDLSVLPVDKQERETQRLLQQEVNYPFNLARGPLLRVTVLRLGAQHHVLLQTMHHIISDGWSMRNFTRELTTLYAAFKEGKTSLL